MIDQVKKQLHGLKASSIITNGDYTKAEQLHRHGNCQILTHAKNSWEILVSPEEDDE